MDEFFLSVEKLSVSIGGVSLLKNINFYIRAGEQWALTGPAGSGKTLFAHTLSGRHFFTGRMSASFGDAGSFHKMITVVEQQHRFRDRSNLQDFYYQQRYNSFDAEKTPVVEEYIASCTPADDATTAGIDRAGLLQLMKMDHLLKQPLIQLSNGENKRLQLLIALLQKQDLLILDQPFTGLDAAGRKLLHEILSLLDKRDVKILLITSAHEIPDYITHVAALIKGSLQSASPKKEYSPCLEKSSRLIINKERLRKIAHAGPADFEFAVIMVGVHVRYGDKQILQQINWKIRKGERWNISGPNGAGKSTLLSLITGDNPQAYANEIYLFDKRRGSGESIWDIKKKIGYISPELHLYFDQGCTVFQAIASGLFDTIGLFRQLHAEQESLVEQWMQFMELEQLQYKRLAHLSAGEQRMVLLARALIKNPPLLILDEPCQGLDEAHIRSFKSLVDLICNTLRTTLIYVSHYQPEIPGCVDKFLKLENGQIVQ